MTRYMVRELGVDSNDVRILLMDDKNDDGTIPGFDPNSEARVFVVEAVKDGALDQSVVEDLELAEEGVDIHDHSNRDKEEAECCRT